VTRVFLTRVRNGLALPDVSFFPFVGPVVRIEEQREDDGYTVRAELPGVDVTKDVDIVAKDGYLRLIVNRVEDTKDRARSEFRYGTFHRTLPLPRGTKEETISASYTNGILEITMKVGQPVHTSKHIPITTS
jgi:HSP20 family molecular chaperone IbpA